MARGVAALLGTTTDEDEIQNATEDTGASPASNKMKKITETRKLL
jgi:hypothetical protein